MALDDVDQRLIQLLRTDARLPVAKLAAQAGISRATATARIERLRRDGIIAGFTIVLQSNVETGGVRAITMIEIEGKQEEAVTRRLMGMPEVRQLHTTNGRLSELMYLQTGMTNDGFYNAMQAMVGKDNAMTLEAAAERLGGEALVDPIWQHYVDGHCEMAFGLFREDLEFCGQRMHFQLPINR